MKPQKEITIRSSAAEYLTFVAVTGDNPAKIFADKELTEEATIRNSRIVQTEGARQVNIALCRISPTSVTSIVL